MSLSNPRIIFGVHSITPYARSTGLPYGIAKVIGSASIALTSELEQLFAGSNKFAWAAEAKTFNSEMTVKVKEYPKFLFELFLGATVTDNAADAAGTVEGLANVNGDSIVDATNGLSDITVSNADNLKYGKYILKATGTGTAKVYYMSDIDIQRGVDVSYVDDTLEVADIDISSATDDLGATLGLSFTKAGTPAFVTDDTAEFYVRPPSTDSLEITVGSSSTSLPAFGAVVLAQKRSTGEIFQIEAFNLVANGLPIALEEQAYSQPEVRLACLYDSSKDAVFKLKAYTPES